MNIKTLLSGCALIIATSCLVQAADEQSLQCAGRTPAFAALMSPVPGNDAEDPWANAAPLQSQPSRLGEDYSSASEHSTPEASSLLKQAMEISALLNELCGDGEDPVAPWGTARDLFNQFNELHAARQYGDIEGVKNEWFALLESAQGNNETADSATRLLVMMNDVLAAHTPEQLAATSEEVRKSGASTPSEADEEGEEILSQHDDVVQKIHENDEEAEEYSETSDNDELPLPGSGKE